MNPGSDITYIAFEGDHCIASGELRAVARAAKETLDRRKEMVAGKAIRGFVELGSAFKVELAAARAPRAEVPVEQLFEFPICVRRALQTPIPSIGFLRCTNSRQSQQENRKRQSYF